MANAQAQAVTIKPKKHFKPMGFGRFLLWIVMIVVTITSIFPFWILIVMSTQSNAEIFGGLTLLPGNKFIKNVKGVVQSGEFYRCYGNSLKVSILSTLVGVFFAALAGFALSKYTFPGRAQIFGFIMATMMVPGQISTIGFLMEMKGMGLVSTHFPLIIGWVTNAFGTYWMTSYQEGSVPLELIESARIDGCNEFMIFLRIVIPCITPAIATLAMLVWMWSWNSYMLPLIMLNKSSMYTIPLFISSLGTAYSTDYAGRMCGLLMATVPIIIIFAIGSKTFVRGLTAGAVKG